MKKATATEESPRRDSLRAMLRGTGCRATPIRLAMLRVLQKVEKPLSMDTLWKEITKKETRAGQSRGADQATVYRAVNDLKKKGILRKIDVGHVHAHYELADNHHHHLICKSCGTVEDISECNIKDLERQALKRARLFHSISFHTLELFGWCSKCEARQEKRQVQQKNGS